MLSFCSVLHIFLIISFAHQHNLPTLHSLDAINGLEDEPLRAYVRGYYPGIEAANIERAQCIALVLTAIGAFKHTRE